jgi:hypothetical protein
VKATSPYCRAKKKQRTFFAALILTFIVVATTIGPLGNRYSSSLLTAASFIAIGGFVACMVLLGTLGLRCPHVAHSIA